MFLNGRKTDKGILKDGDLIGIGDCSIHFSSHSRISSKEEGGKMWRRHGMASPHCTLNPPSNDLPSPHSSPHSNPPSNDPPNPPSFSLATPVRISDGLEGEVRILERAPAEIIVLSLIGRLHDDSVGKFAEFLNRSLAENKVRMVLDLQGTEEICSAGWNLIALQTKRFWAAGGRLALCRFNLKLVDEFRTQKLGTVIEAFSSAYEAISIVSHCAASMQIGTETQNQKDSFANTSLKECVKLIIGRYGPLSCGQIKKKLSEPQYGGKKVSLLKVYLLLRRNGLHTKQNRERFYRSC